MAHVRPARASRRSRSWPPQPGRLLRRRHRGGPHRAQVPHAGASCCPTATWPTAPSRGCCPTSPTLPDIAVPFATEANHTDDDGDGDLPALPARSRRRWPARGPSPARPASMHRIGGIEKAGRHRQHLLRRREPRAHGPAAGRRRSPASPTTSRCVEVDGDVDDAEVLVLGWGSTWGAIDGAVDRVRARGRKVARPTCST